MRSGTYRFEESISVDGYGTDDWGFTVEIGD